MLDVVGQGEKAWYLSPTEIYKFVKKTATSIPHSQPIVEQSINSIADLTKYINDTTRLNVAFDADQTVREYVDTLMICLLLYLFKCSYSMI